MPDQPPGSTARRAALAALPVLVLLTVEAGAVSLPGLRDSMLDPAGHAWWSVRALPLAAATAPALLVLALAWAALHGWRDRTAAAACAAPSMRARFAALARHAAVAFAPVLLAAVPLAPTMAAAPQWLALAVVLPFLAAVAVMAATGWAFALLAAFGRRADPAATRRLAPQLGAVTALVLAASVLRGMRPGAVWPAYAAETLAALIALWAIHRQRLTLRQLLRSASATPDDDPPTLPERMTSAIADHWHLLGHALVVLTLMGSYGVFGGSGPSLFADLLSSLGLLAAAGLGVLACEGLHGRVLARTGAATGLRGHLALRLGRVLRTGAQIAVTVWALVLIARIWGLDLWLGRAGLRAATALLTTATALYALWFIWTLVDTALDWSAARTAGRGTRVRTLLPFLRNVAFIAVAVLAIISVLSNLGVDVAPLLAGAGVVGIAIGIGAQRLVGDVITGIFIIFEDSIALGETVEAAGKTGVVEGLTIRTLRLRDGDGALHSIPFSSITTLKNTSRGYGAYTVSVTILHPEDTDRALAEITRIGEEIARDPAWAAAVTGPFSLWGVDQISPAGVVIKGNIRSHPNAQWGLGRELNRRIAVRFSEIGIQQVQPLAGGAAAGWAGGEGR